MKVLELFCGEGGATRGIIATVGADNVYGIDVNAEALAVNPLAEDHKRVFSLAEDYDVDALFPGVRFDFVWASPPCQLSCRLWGTTREGHYADLVVHTRQRIRHKHYVMENVERAPFIPEKVFKQCGAPLGLKVFRHRLFETNIREVRDHFRSFWVKNHPHSHDGHYIHDPKRDPNEADFYSVAGNGGGVWGTTKQWFEAMGYDDKGEFKRGAMTKRGLAESIPPLYSKNIMVCALPYCTAPHASLDEGVRLCW